MRSRLSIKIIFFIQISFFSSFFFTSSFAQQSQSLQHWQQKTANNPKDALAWFNIGVLYEKGQGVEANQTKAQQSYTRAINLGYAPAMFNLGSIYAQKKDYVNAKFWWEKAANENVPEAQYNLATLYEKGWGVKQDPEKAALWYQRAAETAMQKYLDLYQHSKDKAKQQSAVTTKSNVNIFDYVIPIANAAQVNNIIEVAQVETTEAEPLSGWPWVYSQPGENFTIQLFATKEESKTEKFIQQYALTERAKVIPAIVKGTQYYKVILGSFVEWNDAAVEIGGLPQDLRDERPWVRKFETLYSELPEGTETSVSQVTVAEPAQISEEVVEEELETQVQQQLDSVEEQPEEELVPEEQVAAVEQSSEESEEQIESTQQSATDTSEAEQVDENTDVEQEEVVEAESEEKLASLDKEQAEIKSRMPEKTESDDGPTDDVFTIYAKKQLNSNGLSEPIKEQLQTGLESVRSENYSQAFEQLSPLADAGLPEAQFRLSLLYAEGKGVGLDLNKAFEYAKLSAEQGHPYGQRLLAEFYSNGIGVEANSSLAAYWQQTGDDNIKKLEEL